MSHHNVKVSFSMLKGGIEIPSGLITVVFIDLPKYENLFSAFKSHPFRQICGRTFIGVRYSTYDHTLKHSAIPVVMFFFVNLTKKDTYDKGETE